MPHDTPHIRKSSLDHTRSLHSKPFLVEILTETRPRSDETNETNEIRLRFAGPRRRRGPAAGETGSGVSPASIVETVRTVGPRNRFRLRFDLTEIDRDCPRLPEIAHTLTRRSSRPPADAPLQSPARRGAAPVGDTAACAQAAAATLRRARRRPRRHCSLRPPVNAPLQSPTGRRAAPRRPPTRAVPVARRRAAPRRSRRARRRG